MKAELEEDSGGVVSDLAGGGGEHVRYQSSPSPFLATSYHVNISTIGSILMRPHTEQDHPRPLGSDPRDQPHLCRRHSLWSDPADQSDQESPSHSRRTTSEGRVVGHVSSLWLIASNLGSFSGSLARAV